MIWWIIGPVTYAAFWLAEARHNYGWMRLYDQREREAGRKASSDTEDFVWALVFGFFFWLHPVVFLCKGVRWAVTAHPPLTATEQQAKRNRDLRAIERGQRRLTGTAAV